MNINLSWVKRAAAKPHRVFPHLREQIRRYRLRRVTHPYVIQAVSSALDEPRDEVEQIYDHLGRERDFINSVEDFGNAAGQYSLDEHVVAAYLVTRITKPDLILETGVNTGMSSAFFLKALEENGHGKLHSIDLPGFDDDPVVDKSSPYGEVKYDKHEGTDDIGQRIPDELRHRWELHLGRSDGIMEPLLEDLGNIDVFMHDSDHSYENMLYEFETAYPSLTPSGIILSDDVDWNDSFSEFVDQYDLSHDSLEKHLTDDSRIATAGIVGVASK